MKLILCHYGVNLLIDFEIDSKQASRERERDHSTKATFDVVKGLRLSMGAAHNKASHHLGELFASPTYNFLMHSVVGVWFFK